MRVKCKWKKGDELAAVYVDTRIHWDNITEWYLTKGKEYVVYAIDSYSGQTLYYIVDDDEQWFPIMKPATLFEIVDSRPSSLWRVNFRPLRNSPEEWILTLAIEEWCAEGAFYERLSDKNERETAIFAERKKQMDCE